MFALFVLAALAALFGTLVGGALASYGIHLWQKAVAAAEEDIRG